MQLRWPLRTSQLFSARKLKEDIDMNNGIKLKEEWMHGRDMMKRAAQPWLKS